MTDEYSDDEIDILLWFKSGPQAIGLPAVKEKAKFLRRIQILLVGSGTLQLVFEQGTPFLEVGCTGVELLEEGGGEGVDH